MILTEERYGNWPMAMNLTRCALVRMSCHEGELWMPMRCTLFVHMVSNGDGHGLDQKCSSWNDVL